MISPNPFRQIIAGLVPLLLSLPAMAQEQSTGRVRVSPLGEIWREAVPVSGSSVLGATTSPLDRPILLTGPWIRISEGFSGNLCVRANSRDGRYHGLWSVEIVPGAPDKIPLPLPSQHSAHFHDMTAADLAIAVTQAQEPGASASGGSSGPCRFQGQSLFPVAWRQDDLDHPPTLLINSMQAQTRVLTHNEAGAVMSRSACGLLPATQSSGSKTITFDRACQLSASAHQIAIRWSDGETVISTQEIRLQDGSRR